MRRPLSVGRQHREKTGRVQTNARLIDTASAAHLWADRFDNDFSDLFELQEAVTGRIASSLDIQSVKAECRRATVERAANPDAADPIARDGAPLYRPPPSTTSLRGGSSRICCGSIPIGRKLGPLARRLMNDYLNNWNVAAEWPKWP